MKNNNKRQFKYLGFNYHKCAIVEHKAKVLTKEEVEKNRSSAYKYII